LNPVRVFISVSEAFLKFVQKQSVDLYVPMHTDELLGYYHVPLKPHTGISSNVGSIELQQIHPPVS
jgi:hypothetical protein